MRGKSTRGAWTGGTRCLPSQVVKEEVARRLPACQVEVVTPGALHQTSRCQTSVPLLPTKAEAGSQDVRVLRLGAPTLPPTPAFSTSFTGSNGSQSLSHLGPPLLRHNSYYWPQLHWPAPASGHVRWQPVSYWSDNVNTRLLLVERVR